MNTFELYEAIEAARKERYRLSLMTEEWTSKEFAKVRELTEKINTMEKELNDRYDAWLLEHVAAA